MFEVIAYPANKLGIGITDGKNTRQCTAGDLEILCEIANRSPLTAEVLGSNSTLLLCCPFCDGKAKLIVNGGYRFVKCQKCGAATEESSHESMAIFLWNRRAI